MSDLEKFNAGHARALELIAAGLTFDIETSMLEWALVASDSPEDVGWTFQGAVCIAAKAVYTLAEEWDMEPKEVLAWIEETAQAREFDGELHEIEIEQED